MTVQEQIVRRMIAFGSFVIFVTGVACGLLLWPSTVKTQPRSRFAEYAVYPGLSYLWDKDRQRCFVRWHANQSGYWGEHNFLYLAEATEHTCR